MDVPSHPHPRPHAELMSVQRYETADGSRWRVRWREANGRMRSRSCTSKREAVALDADVRSRKFRGEALPRPGRETLAVAYDEWWRLRGSTLASNTQRTYQAAWNAHVRDRFDYHPLSALVADPQLFEELLADMRERGVGPAAQRKVLVVLSAVLTAAVEWKHIAANPLWAMRKPSAARQRLPRPFPPVVVERIRLQLLRRRTRGRDSLRASRDAAFVSLMSYAGLRPGEALALTWGDIGTRTLSIDKAIADGEVGPTKTGAARSVPLVEPLREDLEELRLTTRMLRGGSGAVSDFMLVIPGHGIGPWSRSEFNNWRNRVWKPTMRRLAECSPPIPSLATARPYDSRGSFVSLHLRAGASPLEVAAWAGHSPQVMFRHYANVIEELVGEPRLSAEEQIWRAREAVDERPAAELDTLTRELYERPTLAAAGGKGAAEIFFAPRISRS